MMIQITAIFCFLCTLHPVSASEETEVDLDEAHIEQYFSAVDADGDGFLDYDELPKWVKKMIDTHVSDSIPTSKKEFRQVDTNRDGIVTWEEYRIMKHEKLDRNLLPNHHPHSDQEMQHKFRTADENGDSGLNINEYAAFKNPMTTRYVLERVAKELLDDLDEDKNGIVSEKEFVHHGASRAEDKTDKEVDEIRKMEFQSVLDTDQNKFLDLKEMVAYLDPRGKTFMLNEARMMMHEADTNSDKKLSLEEIKENYLHFQSHSENPVIMAIHDEF